MIDYFQDFLPEDPVRRAVVVAKLENFQVHGLDAVVADFDRTITDERSVSIPALIRTLRNDFGAEERYCLSQAYVDEVTRLEARYAPLINDPTRPRDEASALCDAWWREHFEALASAGLSESFCDLVLSHPNIPDVLRLRPGTSRFAECLQDRGIPLVLFSAGFGDLIVRYCDRIGLMSANVRIVSNFFEFDDGGLFRGTLRGGKTIHSLSKDEAHIRESLGEDILGDARTVLLLGDHVGDARMADDADGRHVLRVGMLGKHDDPAHVAAYREAFDIVLRDDRVEPFYDAMVRLLEPSGNLYGA